MLQTGTDPRLVKLRKYESILVISGFGVIAFGLWSIIRAAIYYFLNPLDVANYIEESELAEIMAMGQEDGVEFITNNLGPIITACIFTILIVDLLFRLYVGLSARKDGRRRKRHGFYLVITWIMAILMLMGICTSIHEIVAPVVTELSENADTALQETAQNGDQAASVSVLVDITSFLVLLEVGVCGIMVRRLRKQLGIKSVGKQKKGRKQNAGEIRTEEIMEELNIPMNKEEAKELGEEISQKLSDGLSNID